MRSSPHDLAVIFRAALAYPMFAHIAAQPSALFPDDFGYKEIVNQDELLQRYPGALGGKTGYTNIARKTYVGAAQRNGRRLVVVQMYGEGDVRPGDRSARLGLRQLPSLAKLYSGRESSITACWNAVSR